MNAPFSNLLSRISPNAHPARQSKPKYAECLKIVLCNFEHSGFHHPARG
jgi:hypothetical protein